MKNLSLALIILIAGCKTAKDNHAFNRVISDEQLSERTYKQLEKSHPCNVDTIIQVKDGKEIIRYDTLDNSHTDTLYNTDTQTKIVTEYKTVVKYVNKTDTVIHYQIDNRRLDLAIEDANIKQGQITQLQNDLKETKATSNKKTWWLIGAGALFILLTWLRIKKII